MSTSTPPHSSKSCSSRFVHFFFFWGSWGEDFCSSTLGWSSCTFFSAGARGWVEVTGSFGFGEVIFFCSEVYNQWNHFPKKNLEIKLFFQILACRVKWLIERICRKNLILAEISKLELNWTAQSLVPSFWTFYKTSNTHNERRADRGRLGHVVWLGDDRRHIPERRLATGRRRSLEFIHFFIKQDLKINTLLAKNAHNKMWQFSDKAYIIRKKNSRF